MSLWRNKNGTSERSCRCGSWKQHWINYSGTAWPRKCSVQGCYNSATLGAHICKLGEAKEYIVPMCDQCNLRTDSFAIDNYTVLVSANKNETCNR